MDTEKHIAKRNRVIREEMRIQDTSGQIVSGIRQVIGNGIDRLTGWADDDRVVFLGATAAGLVRGAVYGGLIALLAIAASASVAAIGPLVFFGSAIAGAIVYGIYDGQSALEDHVNKGEGRAPATKGKESSVETPPPGQRVEAQKQPATQMNEQGDTVVQNTAPAATNAFTASEDARRAKSAVTLER